HVTIDMQAGVNEPLASPLTLTSTVAPRPPLAAGQAATLSFVATNSGVGPATAVVVEAPLPAQLDYQPGSTQRDGVAVPDIVTPAEEGVPEAAPPAAPASPLQAGFDLGTLEPGASTTITYAATTKVPVASAADLVSSTIRSTENPAPAAANGPKAVDMAALADAIRALPEVRAAQPFGLVDLPPGSVTVGDKALDASVKVVGVDPRYAQDLPLVGFSGGEFTRGTAFVSPAVAQRGAGPGSTLSIRIPGTPAAPNSESTAFTVPVGAVADLSGADQLFASRAEDSLGDFVSAPFVVGVDLGMFQRQVLPAVRVDAGSAVPAVSEAPVLEVHVELDRGGLDSDPAAARRSTAGVRRSIERIVPGEVTVIDNLSVGLERARTDTSLAKVLFMALGLPGALLAGYLAFYGGTLLAEAERRERALLRARGFTPLALTRAVAYQAAAIAVLGSVIGAALALAAAGVLFPPEVDPGNPALAFGVGAIVSIVVTVLAIYLPARRALLGDVTSARQEVVAAERPGWLRVRLDLWLLVAAVVVSVVFVLLGGLKPKPGAVEESVAKSFYILLAPWCLWLGGVLLAARIFLGVSRRVGARTSSPDFRHHLVRRTMARSVTRRPAVVSAGIVMVSLAVAFGVSLAIFVATFRDQQQADARFVVGSDVRVTVSPGQQLPTDVEQRLRVPGVDAVTAVAQVPDAVLGSEKLLFAAVDPATFADVAGLSPGFFTEGSPDEAMKALAEDPNAVIVDRETADTFNVGLGDTIKLQVPSPALGQPTLLPLTVVATVIQFPGFPTGLDFVGNLDTYRQATGAVAPSYYLLRTDGSAATDARVAAELTRSLGADVPARISTTAEVGNPDQSSIAGLSLTGLGRVEGFYMVLIASLGIVIFVAMLLTQRNTERAVMRALGLARRPLRSIMLGEASIVAAVSVVVGSVIGVPMAYMFVQVLRRIFVVPPTLSVPPSLGLLLVGLLAVTVAISAAILSVSARRLKLVELLRTE
ncbi:MAG: putative transport system permease protein, partial [Actinomycetota bacterium]|nr:putative transport system permease protein [Actinomycetota bacterium]